MLPIFVVAKESESRVWWCYEGSLINLSLSYNILLQAAAIKWRYCNSPSSVLCSLRNVMVIISLLQDTAGSCRFKHYCTALTKHKENSNKSFYCTHKTYKGNFEALTRIHQRSWHNVSVRAWLKLASQ